MPASAVILVLPPGAYFAAASLAVLLAAVLGAILLLVGVVRQEGAATRALLVALRTETAGMREDLRRNTQATEAAGAAVRIAREQAASREVRRSAPPSQRSHTLRSVAMDSSSSLDPDYYPPTSTPTIASHQGHDDPHHHR